MTQQDATGWFRDPTGRNEARYFVRGQPTELVRRDGQEVVDPMTTTAALPPMTTMVDDHSVESDAFGEEPPESTGRRSFWVVAGALGLLVLAAIGTLLVRRAGDEGDASTATPTTALIDTASALRNELCTGPNSSGCTVESSPGVIEVYMSKYTVDESGLVSAGNRTGLWTSADVARMLRTRALDGTQRTADGRVSWTYHPDNGLQLVIDVSG